MLKTQICVTRPQCVKKHILLIYSVNFLHKYNKITALVVKVSQNCSEQRCLCTSLHGVVSHNTEAFSIITHGTKTAVLQRFQLSEVYEPFKDEVQAALFKDPVRTAL